MNTQSTALSGTPYNPKTLTHRQPPIRLDREHIGELSAAITVFADPLVKSARRSAHEEFVEKTRKVPKDSGLVKLPYVVHLEEVASLLFENRFGAEVIAAGYLHDHWEDLKPRGWTIERIADEFGARVAELVSWVTQLDKGQSWEERNLAYAERLKLAPDDAVAISIADKISNIGSCVRYLRMGYAVSRQLSRGWKKNSEKFHELDSIFEGRVPERMLRQFRRLLAEFDRLGSALEEVA